MAKSNFNTIILKHGTEILTYKEYERFEIGDTIWGDNCNPIEIRRWNIEQEDEAKTELEKYRYDYRNYPLSNSYHINEYALEYCECDEDGEFIMGSDYDLATPLHHYTFSEINGKFSGGYMMVDAENVIDAMKKAGMTCWIKPSDKFPKMYFGKMYEVYETGCPELVQYICHE